MARWHRLLGDEVFFLTGTDEHGLKVQRAAEANGLTPQEQADQTSERYREAWAALDITYDDFIRTSEPRHHQATQALMQAAYDNGWIELRPYEGLYCVSCEAYYTEAELVDGLLLPDPRHARRAAVGGQLLLQAVRVLRPPARVVRRPTPPPSPPRPSATRPSG